MIWGIPGRDAGSLVLEPAGTEHARALADLHAMTFPRPWTDGEFYDLLKRPQVSGHVLARSAATAASVCGFILVQTAADEVEILSVAVDPAWQGRGAGARLVDTVLREAYKSGVVSVFLEVEAGNAPALSLYRKHGFTEVASRPGYYAGPEGARRTALVMRRDVR